MSPIGDIGAAPDHCGLLCGIPIDRGVFYLLPYTGRVTSEQRIRETEEFFHQQIPITRAMGIRVESYDGDHLTLTAPLSLNHNHLGTAFGGSLSAVATLAGYGLLWLELGNPAAHIVIRESAICFRRPVRDRTMRRCRYSRQSFNRRRSLEFVSL